MLGSFSELFILTLFIGFSIFLSLPIIFSRNLGKKSIVGLTAGAAGILIFLLADIFSDVASTIYPQGSYVASPALSGLFALCAGGSFLSLYLLENRRSPEQRSSPMNISLMVAVAIGFQNLTEGLVFGSTWALGVSGLVAVIFVGFVLQNFTEGFPIISPFLGGTRPKMSVISSLFLIGAFPTIFGSLIGFYYSSTYLNVLFDALAIGSILYILMPMLQAVFWNMKNRATRDMAYLGIVGGFLIGFLVNSI